MTEPLAETAPTDSFPYAYNDYHPYRVCIHTDKAHGGFDMESAQPFKLLTDAVTYALINPPASEAFTVWIEMIATNGYDLLAQYSPTVGYPKMLAQFRDPLNEFSETTLVFTKQALMLLAHEQHMPKGMKGSLHGKVS